MSFDFADTVLSGLVAWAGIALGSDAVLSNSAIDKMILIVSIIVVVMCIGNIIHNALCYISDKRGKTVNTA